MNSQLLNPNSQRQNLLEKVDIFGVEINFRYNKQNKHKTRFGGFVSLAVFAVLLLLLQQLIRQVIQQTNPKVLFQQQIVNNPSKYPLNNNNFSFVMSMIYKSQFFIADPSLFRFEAVFFHKVITTNPDGTKQDPVFTQTNLEIELCHADSFQVKGTEDYFQNIPYQQMYCFKNIEDFYLVGQFEKDEFSTILISAIVCEDDDPKNTVKCMEETKKMEMLSHLQLQLFYTNYIVHLSDKGQPFQSMGVTNFWEVSSNFQQNIDIKFINTYVQDDDGLVFSNNKSQNQLLFSDSRSTLITKSDNKVFFISVYLEKNKEQIYIRDYPKLSSIFSEVGGLFNVLFMVGCLIAQPYSQFQLNRKLFNSTFDIHKNQDDTNHNNNNNNNNEQSNGENSKNSENHSSNNCVNFPKSDFVHEQFSNMSKSQRKKQLSFKQNQINKKKLQVSKFHVFNLKDETNEENINTTIQQILKNQIKSITVKTSEFLSYYLTCFRKFKSEFFQIVDFGTQQIFNYTDICFVVNKLIELEKLKAVVLNDQQIKLFEFIPKPKIDISLIKELNELTHSTLKQQVTNPADQCDSPQKQFTTHQTIAQAAEESLQFPQKNSFNILSIKNRSIFQKAKYAQEAFNKICQESSQSQIDFKLIQMLDKNLLMLLQNNKLNDNNLSFLKTGQNSVALPQRVCKMERLSSINKSESQNISEIPTHQQNQFIELTEMKQELKDETQFNEIEGSGFHIYQNRTKNFMKYAEQQNARAIENLITSPIHTTQQ